MARFKLSDGVTDKDVGAEIRKLVAKPKGQLAEIDATALFARLFVLSPRTEIRLVKDERYVRHIVIPFYEKKPTKDADELLGTITVRGCGE